MSRSQPAGFVSSDSRSVIRLLAPFNAMSTEYGSLVTFVSTAPSDGTHTFTL